MSAAMALRPATFAPRLPTCRAWHRRATLPTRPLAGRRKVRVARVPPQSLRELGNLLGQLGELRGLASELLGLESELLGLGSELLGLGRRSSRPARQRPLREARSPFDGLVRRFATRDTRLSAHCENYRNKATFGPGMRARSLAGQRLEGSGAPWAQLGMPDSMLAE